MIKVIYRLRVIYREQLYTFNIKGTLVAIPRKDEIVDINARVLKVKI